MCQYYYSPRKPTTFLEERDRESLKLLDYPPYAYTVSRVSSLKNSVELRLGHCPLLVSCISVLLFFVAVENEVDKSIARALMTECPRLLTCTDRFRMKSQGGIRIVWLTDGTVCRNSRDGLLTTTYVKIVPVNQVGMYTKKKFWL